MFVVLPGALEASLAVSKVDSQHFAIALEATERSKDR